MAYESLALSKSVLAAVDSLEMRAVVRDLSAVAAPETVQCYLVLPAGDDAPGTVLVEFAKVELAPHSSREAAFQLSSEPLRLVDARGERVWRPGEYQIFVGPASPGPRAQALGAPAPLTAPLRLV